MDEFGKINRLAKFLICFILLLIITVFAFMVPFPEGIPNCIVLFFGHLGLIVLPALYFREVPWISKQLFSKLWIVLLTLSISLGNWYFISYFSYYDGVHNALMSESSVVYAGTKAVLNSNVTDLEKKQRLLNIFKRSKAEIVVSKNDEVFVEKLSYRDKVQYELTNIGPNKGYTPITVNGDVYKFSYKYANKPYKIIGVTRAVTFSVIPDFYPVGLMLDYYEGIKLYPYQNINYINRALYDRSKTLWWLFIPLNFVLMWLASYKRKYEIMNDDHAELYLRMNHKLSQDIAMITTSNVRNILQDMVSNWRESSISSEEYAKTHEAMQKSARFEIHNIKNKCQSKENDFYVKNEDQIMPYVNRIIEDLRKLPDLISLEMKLYSIKDLLKTIKEMDVLSNSKCKGDGLEINYKEFNNGYDLENMYCNVNLNKIKTIINALIDNSMYATYLQEDKEFDKDINSEYIRKIFVETNIVIVNNEKYFLVSVKDNGGGFSEPDRIYRFSIKSSKKNPDGSERIGDGTRYIQFFVNMFNGKIEANNYVAEENILGAKTDIYIPIKMDI